MEITRRPQLKGMEEIRASGTTPPWMGKGGLLSLFLEKERGVPARKKKNFCRLKREDEGGDGCNRSENYILGRGKKILDSEKDRNTLKFYDLGVGEELKKIL